MPESISLNFRGGEGLNKGIIMKLESELSKKSRSNQYKPDEFK